MNDISPKKKIFITGATGYIGKAVIKAFLAKGYEIIALVRISEKAEEVEKLGAKAVLGDLSQIDLIFTETEGCNGIIHCARDHSGTLSSDQLDYDAVDVFLKSAKRNAQTKPCTFIYTSGNFLLGNSDEVQDEFSPIIKPHPHGKWRQAPEEKVLEFSDNIPNMTTISLRPSWVYDTQGGYYMQYMNACKEDNVAYQVGDGNSYVNFVHVEDLAELYCLLLEKNESGIFHGTDGNYVKISDMTEFIKNNLGCEIKEVTVEEGCKRFGYAAYSHVINQKLKATRSTEVGWKLKYPSFLELIPEMLISKK